MTGVGTRAPDLHAFVLPRERAAAKLRAGRPLLHDEPVVLDLAFATDLFLRLAGERRLDVGRLDLAAVLTEAFVQHADHVQQIAARPDLDAELIARLAEQAVRPLRRAYAGRLGHLVEGWQRGYCPICGGSAAAALPASPGQPGQARCEACGCTWPGAAGGPAFRIELALPAEDA
jgi:hypothetical protein